MPTRRRIGKEEPVEIPVTEELRKAFEEIRESFKDFLLSLKETPEAFTKVTATSEVFAKIYTDINKLLQQSKVDYEELSYLFKKLERTVDSLDYQLGYRFYV